VCDLGALSGIGAVPLDFGGLRSCVRSLHANLARNLRGVTEEEEEEAEGQRETRP
jgi:hypothetical protein